MPEPVLSVRGLQVGFAAAGRILPAVRGVDFDVFPNEVVGIVGESGSGKSVTSLAITGLLGAGARVQGSIRLGDTEVTSATPETLRRLRGQDVGTVFQDPSTTLNPVFEVGRQVVEGQVSQGRLAPGQAAQRAADLLREVDIPDPQRRVHQYPHQFSGGMRQRVVIAMAMAGQPRLIIADEPTTALDVTVQAQVLAVLARRQAETGAAVILITHDLGVIAEVANRVLVMYGGRIVESGPVEEIFAQPRHPYTVGLLRSMPRLDGEHRRLIPITGQPPSPVDLPQGCVFHPRCAWASEAAGCHSREPALQPVSPVHASACHRSAESFGAVPHEPVPASAPIVRTADRTSAPLLQVQGLRVHFPIKSSVLRRQIGSVRAVDGVDLQVHAGETLGLVGESGCGKTTTGRAIMGLLPVAGGAVRFDGQDVTRLSAAERRRQRRHMQYVFQDPYASLNPIKTVNEIVAEPLRIHGLFDESGGQAWIDELLERVGLSSSMASRFPSEFSGGQRQRIGIARALALKPRLLILDEPVAALDVSIQAQIINLLQDLQQGLGLAYIFIAHDLSVVRHIADRVAVMYLGRVVEEADKRHLYGSPTHPYTQSLLSAVPLPDPRLRSQRRRIILEGDIPNPAAPPSGCHFHPRCFRAAERCRSESPALSPLAGGQGLSACHFGEVTR